MFNVPLTFHYDFTGLEEYRRQEVLAEFAAAGAEHLVLSDDLVGEILRNPAFLKQLQGELSSHGLSFVDSHAPFERYNELNCPDPVLWPVTVAMQLHVLEIAAASGVKTVCMHTGGNVWHYAPGEPYAPAPDPEISHCVNRISRALEILLPRAEKLGLIICLENIWHETNTADRLLEFKSRFPTPALGFCFDAGHANLMRKYRGTSETAPEKSWKVLNKPVPYDSEILEKLQPHIATCHLHGNDGLFDRHRMLADGDIDWEAVCAGLHRAPRLQCIQSEIQIRRNQLDIAAVVTDFRQRLR